MTFPSLSRSSKSYPFWFAFLARRHFRSSWSFMKSMACCSTSQLSPGAGSGSVITSFPSILLRSLCKSAPVNFFCSNTQIAPSSKPASMRASIASSFVGRGNGNGLLFRNSSARFFPSGVSRQLLLPCLFRRSSSFSFSKSFRLYPTLRIIASTPLVDNHPEKCRGIFLNSSLISLLLKYPLRCCPANLSMATSCHPF